MSRVRSRHPEDFELLCYAKGELEESENAIIRAHVADCDRCLIALTEIRQVDAGLRARTGAGARQPDDELSSDDPFYARPERTRRAGRATQDLADRGIEAAQRGGAEVKLFLSAAEGSAEELQRFLADLSFAHPGARYLLLYGLDEAVRRLPDAPGRFLRVAEAVLARLEAEDRRPLTSPPDAEILVPIGTLMGQAHQLAGQAANWTGELEKARVHLEASYKSFPYEMVSDEIRLAMTELDESQRRTFVGQSAEALVLAKRAGATFEPFGMDDFSARARVVEGLALAEQGDYEGSLSLYRSAMPVFERLGLWKNYISVLTNIGASLGRLGRLEEARREYARSLKKVSRDQHPSLLAFLRMGLGRVLFFGRQYRDAAKSFLQAAGLFREVEQIGDLLSANLWEIESWARSGDTARARHRLEIFRASVDHVQALDPFIGNQLEVALSGRDPDLERIAELRERAETTLRGQFEARTG
jgi:tetratricopeptide (TPR) repeat protein